jgi:hypothetical protein
MPYVSSERLLCGSSCRRIRRSEAFPHGPHAGLGIVYLLASRFPEDIFPLFSSDCLPDFAVDSKNLLEIHQ